MSAARADDRARRRPVSRTERLLLAVGVDPAVLDDVLGDLDEEHAERAAVSGADAARRWYVRELLRAVPHFVWSVLRRVERRRRIQALAGLVGLLATLCFWLLWRGTAAAPPARLVAGVRDTVLVNHVRAMAMPMRVLDSLGRPLPDSGVRYAWVSGAPVTISPRGAIVCDQPGDATVRASLGALTADLQLLCRPVEKVRVVVWNDFLLGDPARELPAEIIGVDGHPVGLLSARIGVEDSTVATINGLFIRPLRPGFTSLSLTVGNRSTGAAIRVFAPVQTLEGLRPAERPADRFVAAAVALGPAASMRWPLPPGLFSLQFLPDRQADPHAGPPALALSVDGPIMCLPAPSPRVYSTRCLARGRGATVTVTLLGNPERTIVGALALAWEREQ